MWKCQCVLKYSTTQAVTALVYAIHLNALKVQSTVITRPLIEKSNGALNIGLCKLISLSLITVHICFVFLISSFHCALQELKINFTTSHKVVCCRALSIACLGSCADDVIIILMTKIHSHLSLSLLEFGAVSAFFLPCAFTKSFQFHQQEMFAVKASSYLCLSVFLFLVFRLAVSG